MCSMEVVGTTEPIDIEEFGLDEDKNDRNGGEGGRMFEGEAGKGKRINESSPANNAANNT